MGMGMIISPPALSAVQELKIIVELIADKKEFAACLSELEAAIISGQKLAEANGEAARINAGKEASLLRGERDLEAGLNKCKALELEIDAKNLSVNKKLSEVIAREKSLEEAMSNFLKESALCNARLDAKEKYLENRDVDIENKKLQAEGIKNEYEGKIRKLAGVINE